MDLAFLFNLLTVALAVIGIAAAVRFFDWLAR
jgi:hypothetical protein